MPELYIGLMSGTSIDSIDAVLVRFDQSQPEILGYSSETIPSEIRHRLHDVCLLAGQAPLHEVTRLDVLCGRLFALAAQRLLDKFDCSAQQVTAIGSHGQTIYHNPDSATPGSTQIGDPNIIAELTGITTVADFRRRDIAAGGQGAPLVPAFHQSVFQHEGEDRVVVNIGGIANITVLPGDKQSAIYGFDTGPGNTLIDLWVKQQCGQDMDKDASYALRGRVNIPLLEHLQSDPYFCRAAPKSTGREYFNKHWLEQYLVNTKISPEDVQATLCQLTAATILTSITNSAPSTQRLLVCGGGVHNPLIMQALKDNTSKIQVSSTSEFGVMPEQVEAIAFAWLAKQTLNSEHGSIAAVTGARKPSILGAIYPGEKL